MRLNLVQFRRLASLPRGHLDEVLVNSLRHRLVHLLSEVLSLFHCLSDELTRGFFLWREVESEGHDLRAEVVADAVLVEVELADVLDDLSLELGADFFVTQHLLG